MLKVLISGGSGLKGIIAVKGSKNLATKAIIATLLTSESCILHNVPLIGDVEILLEILRKSGSEIDYESTSTIILNTKNVREALKISHFASLIRVSVLLSGPLLVRTGRASFPFPGGCNIGHRPIDFHLNYLKSAGAKIEYSGNQMIASAEGLKGCSIELPYPSVTATEHIILTAVLAKGETNISNYSKTPETGELIKMLRSMGAKINLADDQISIQGVEELHGVEFTVMPDRNEAITFSAAAIACRSDLQINNFPVDQSASFFGLLDNLGVRYLISETSVSFFSDNKLYKPFFIESGPYPELETDWIPLIAVLLNSCNGAGLIHERVFENRLDFMQQLSRLGMKIRIGKNCPRNSECAFNRNYFHTASISGNQTLTGTELHVPDLRGGAALILAALSARGDSVMYDEGIIGRGYESFYSRLQSVGARIRILES